MATCPKCGKQIEDEAYCPKCGEPIEEIISQKIAGYLFQMANYYYLSKEYKDAEPYAEKLIKNDPNNSQAWMLKGNIQAYTSPGDDLSYGKSIKAWKTAISLAKNESDDFLIKKKISEEMLNGFSYSIYTNASVFSREPNNVNLRALETCKKYISVCDLLKYQVGVDLSEDDLSEFLANQMKDAALNASEAANSEFGKTNAERTNDKFQKWIETTNICIEALENAAEIATKPATVQTCYQKATILQQKMIESKSYKEDGKGKGGSIIDTVLANSVVKEKKKAIESYVKLQSQRIKELQKKKK